MFPLTHFSTHLFAICSGTDAALANKGCSSFIWTFRTFSCPSLLPDGTIPAACGNNPPLLLIPIHVSYRQLNSVTELGSCLRTWVTLTHTLNSVDVLEIRTSRDGWPESACSLPAAPIKVAWSVEMKRSTLRVYPWCHVRERKSDGGCHLMFVSTKKPVSPWWWAWWITEVLLLSLPTRGLPDHTGSTLCTRSMSRTSGLVRWSHIGTRLDF